MMQAWAWASMSQCCTPNNTKREGKRRRELKSKCHGRPLATPLEHDHLLLREERWAPPGEEVAAVSYAVCHSNSLCMMAVAEPLPLLFAVRADLMLVHDHNHFYRQNPPPFHSKVTARPQQSIAIAVAIKNNKRRRHKPASVTITIPLPLPKPNHAFQPAFL